MIYTPSPAYEEGLRLQEAYRAYNVVGGKVVIQGAGATMAICGTPTVPPPQPWVNRWLLLDTSNGNPELGSGYCWVFRTRQEARQHRNQQNANPALARVVGPWRAAEAKRRFLRLYERPLRGRSQLRS